MQLHPSMIFGLNLTHQSLAARRVWSWRGWRSARLMLHRPIALQALLVQTLLVAPNVAVALRFEVGREPIHLGNSLIANHPRKIK